MNKIVIVAATPFEIAPLIQHLEAYGQKKSFSTFTWEGKEIYPLITGVGMINTIYALSKAPEVNEAELLVNCGIAGSFEHSLNIGAVVEVTRDRFGDLGVEEADGSFTDVYQMDLMSPDQYPYTNGWLVNEKSKLDLGLLKVDAITVNKVHGEKKNIAKIKEKYKAHLESMEGAAFMMYCANLMTKYHQIRSISNYVEARNKENWNIPLAIDQLNKKVIEVLKSV